MTQDSFSASKPQLLLLSGLLCDESVWAEIVPQLNDVANISIFSFPTFSSITAMAEHVLGSTTGRIAIVGHSMGGRVALEIFRLAPERVTGLALLNTGVNPMAEHEPEKRGKLVELSYNEGMEAMAKEWLPPMMGASDKRIAELMPALIEMVTRSNPDSFANQIQALLNRPDANSILPHIQVPTLLLSADNDRWSPPSQHEAMQKHIVGSKLVVVEGAGHMAPVERPSDVAAAIKNWFSSLIVSDISHIERISIEHECTRKIIQYAALIDAMDFQSVADMYTKHGIFARPSDPDTLVYGRENILNSFLSRPARNGKHIITNIVIEVKSKERVSASSCVTLYLGGADTKPDTISATMVGNFDDVLIYDEGEWRFASRRGSLTFKS